MSSRPAPLALTAEAEAPRAEHRPGLRAWRLETRLGVLPLRYGDDHSPTSAYNTYANEPPRLLCETSGEKHEYVTKNTFMFSRIDPDELCAKLMQMGK